jgi:malate dehydrogenase (oxaloacetate-decarboxylating)
VVSDGSAVLGLGDIGPEAAMPVMEGKAMLFKQFGGVDAWPIVLNVQDPDQIVEIVKAISPGFGGINLEDISAPRCFYIEERLKQEMDIPVFHDDQHGTAVVVLAALINAMKVAHKSVEDLRVVVVGAGASGIACTKIMRQYGIKDIVSFDSKGAINRSRDYGSNKHKQWLADNTNPRNFGGSLEKAMTGADFFLGLSGPGVLTRSIAAKMNEGAILFALSNPDPEILPEDIPKNVKIVATGRTDYPNQVNNSLCFPGFFRGLLDARAREVSDEMKVAAAKAIAQIIPQSSLSEDFIIPSVFDKRVAQEVAKEVTRVARETNTARHARSQNDYFTRRMV